MRRFKISLAVSAGLVCALFASTALAAPTFDLGDAAEFGTFFSNTGGTGEKIWNQGGVQTMDPGLAGSAITKVSQRFTALTTESA